MTRVISFLALVCICICSVPGAAGDKNPKKPSTPTGTLTVDLPTSSKGPRFVLVSLYRNGGLVRSRELERFHASLDLGTLNSRGPITWKVTWMNLPCGTYEVCFEAKGYARGCKRVRVCSEDGDELVVHVELDEKGYRLGDGPPPGTGSGN
jgi:hypothetical protein